MGFSVQEPLGVMIGFPMAIGIIMNQIRLQADVEGQILVVIDEILMMIIIIPLSETRILP